MAESLRKNERIYFAIENTIADGLGVCTVGVNAFHNLKGLVDKMVNNEYHLITIKSFICNSINLRIVKTLADSNNSLLLL